MNRSHTVHLILGVVVVASALQALVVNSTTVHAAKSNDTCKPAEVIYARGSGQDVDQQGKEGRRFFSQMTQRIGENNIHTYEVGSETYDGTKYPAIAINAPTAIGASLSFGYFGKYGDSVNQGVKELKKYLGDRLAKCPNARFVIGGYSQGAQVVRQATYGPSSNLTNHIDFLALFGDPKLYLPEGLGFSPKACRGLDYSSYRRFVPNCYTSIGSLGKQDPFASDALKNKTGLWCNWWDGICGSSPSEFDLRGHDKYKDEGGGIDQAALEAARRLKSTLAPAIAAPVNVKHGTKTGADGLDTVFVIDTTGSMAGRIEQAKTFARQSATKIKENNGRVALVAYRDSGDEYTAKVLSDLQSDQTDFLQKLDSLTVGGGGDIPEATMHALMTAFNGVTWKNGATKATIVLTDAGYHSPDPVDGSTLAAVTKRSLEIDPVNVYPVVPLGIATEYQDLANATSGQVISDDGDTVSALTTALTKIINRPIVQLKNSAYYAPVNATVRFDASDSYIDDATITGYDWDFNGDGTFDRHTSIPSTEFTYAADTDGFMQVRATADNGTVASASVPVKIGTPAVASQPKPIAAPTNLRVTAAPTVPTTATLSWQPSDGTAVKWRIALDGIPAGYVNASQTSLQVTDLDRSNDITFTVTAIATDDSMGNSAEVILAKTSTGQPPAQPSPPCVTILGFTFCLGFSFNINFLPGLTFW